MLYIKLKLNVNFKLKLKIKLNEWFDYDLDFWYESQSFLLYWRILSLLICLESTSLKTYYTIILTIGFLLL